MQFKSAYNNSKEDNLCTPSGTKIVTEHSEKMDSKGRRFLAADRKINVYEKIQASKESCDINVILRRATEGDINVLNVANGSYMDIVDAPSSLAEAQQFVIRAKAEFDKLPYEVKNKFENNAEMYVAAYGTKVWEDNLGITKAREIEKQIAENKKYMEELNKKALETIIKEKGTTNE